jgi:DNA-binding CsgD family transcriptional regulator
MTALRRAERALVGRSTELEAIADALASSHNRLTAASLEGEPGIGKSTILAATADMAIDNDMTPVIVAADEELRGPLLFARELFASNALRDAARDAGELDQVEQVSRSINGNPENDGLTRDERLLRLFDQASICLRSVAKERPLALLIDDAQWADQDSIRMLRYLVRTSASAAIFLAFTTRTEEMALVPELVNLFADLERVAILRRLKVGRFRQAESGALLKQLLGSEVDRNAVATIHAQAEGVPFIVEEIVRTYREAGMLQQLGDQWTLARHAERLLPSGVRTIIQRRAASLNERTKSLLSVAAIIGRSFRVADVCTIRAKVAADPMDLAEASGLLESAKQNGLLTEAGAAGADYAFAHEHVREYALELLSPPQRRQVHTAIVDLLTGSGEPAPELIPHIVRHAIAAGDTERTALYSIQAARGSLDMNAPEEALRVVEQALALVSSPQQRVELLRLRDDALEVLGRSGERLEAIAEFAALAEAVGEDALRLEVNLRRAGALRLDGQFDAAADVARGVRERASAKSDQAQELAACLELGQCLLHSSLGEGYTPTTSESDIPAAEEAFGRAAELAESLDDQRSLASALRELGVIKLAMVRQWFVEQVQAGQHLPVVQRLVGGASLDDVLLELPIAPLVNETNTLLKRALDIYESIGDRRGVMSSIISLAYSRWGAELHIGMNAAERFEGIRKMASNWVNLTRESERDLAEAQMLYGVHVFARAKVIPDLAVSRGQQAYERARALGERQLEFMSAIGTALAHCELDDVGAAAAWLDRAQAVAANSPTPYRALRLAAARVVLAGAQGDVKALTGQFARAMEIATGQRRPAAQCDVRALFVTEAARLGASRDDEELMDAALAGAAEVRRLAADMPGQPLWAAQANAAAARVALARGQADEALDHARAALKERQAALRDDPHLEILLPAARTILSHGDAEEKAHVTAELQLLQGLIAQRTLDDEVRAAFFKSTVGRELAELTGARTDALQAAATESAEGPMSEEDLKLLRLLMEGRTNREIGEELGIEVPAVGQALAAMYARVGANSRAEATAMALRTA